MDNGQNFSVDLNDLKMQHKEGSSQVLSNVDVVAETRGFVDRMPRRGGRKPSPRTQQVHAKVLPPISDEIAEEARRRGVVQGVLIEEGWALYKKMNRI